MESGRQRDGLTALQVNLRHLRGPVVQQLLLQESGEESKKKVTCLRSFYSLASQSIWAAITEYTDRVA